MGLRASGSGFTKHAIRMWDLGFKVDGILVNPAGLGYQLKVSTGLHNWDLDFGVGFNVHDFLASLACDLRTFGLRGKGLEPLLLFFL